MHAYLYWTLVLLVPCIMGQNLRVVVYPERPIFYFNIDGEPEGLAYDVLQGSLQLLQSAFGMSVTVTFNYTNSVQNMLTLLVSQQADIGIPSLILPLDVTAVANTSTAYYNTVLRAVARVQRTGDFPMSYDGGIGTGIYWSWVTISSIGYGDVVTKTIIGKGFTLIVIVSGIVLLNLFSGVITSTLTQNILQPLPLTLDDFALSTTAVTDASFALWYVRAVNTEVTIVESVPAGIEAVKRGRVTYFVHDQATLIAYNFTEPNLTFVGPSFEELDYKYLYSNSLSADFMSDMNKAIYLFRGTQLYTSILRNYFNFTINGTEPANLGDEFNRVWLPNVVLVTILGGYTLFYFASALVMWIVRRQNRKANTMKNKENQPNDIPLSELEPSVDEQIEAEVGGSNS